MIKAIIFDKDGTLIDFDAFWISVSESAVRILLDCVGRGDVPMDEMLASIGVKGGVSDIGGLLCGGTYEEIALAFNSVLEKYGCALGHDEVCKTVLDAYNKSAVKGTVKPTCENINAVLTALKEKGITLAVVTTDNTEITRYCLDKLGITELFDKLYTDDGKTPIKPAPEAALDFIEYTGAGKDEVIMVGDTMTDVRFARNAGILSVAVGANEENRSRLAEFADKVLPDVSHLCAFVSEE